MKIGSLIGSLKASNQLQRQTKAMARALERLSSGLRINHASDDASGLSIATGLEARIRSTSRGILNINDASGILATAGSAIQTQTEIVQRIRELAVQASNSILSGEERGYLQEELDQLISEFDRIAKQTDFNGTKLLDGSLESFSIQLSGERNNRIEVELPSSTSQNIFTKDVGAGVFSSSQNYALEGDTARLGDFNGDGINDLMELDGFTIRIKLGQSDGSYKTSTQMSKTLSGNSPSDYAIADVNHDGIDDIIGGAESAVFLSDSAGHLTRINYDTAGTTNFFGVRTGDLNGDGNLDLITTNISMEAKVYFGNGEGGFSFEGTYAFGAAPNVDIVTSFAAGNYSFDLSDTDHDGDLDLLFTSAALSGYLLNDGNGSFTLDSTFAAGVGIELIDLNGDGFDDRVVLQNSGGLRIELNQGDGSFGAAQTISEFTLNHSLRFSDMDGDGDIDIIGGNSDKDLIVYLNDGNSNFSKSFEANYGALAGQVTSFEVGDLNQDGVSDILTYNPSGSNTAYLSLTKEVSAQSEIRLDTKEKASRLIDLSDRALQNLLDLSSRIGATQSRLDSALNSLLITRENLSASRSQILDADIAEETAELTRAQILQQAAAAVNVQTNLNLQIILKLLDNISR